MEREDDGFITADDYKDAFLSITAPTVAAQQCGLDEKALDVALSDIGAKFHFMVKRAIRAYLEAATPPDVAGLVEKLEGIQCPPRERPIVTEAATALRLSAGGGVPEGWKLVPVEPTPGMIMAAHADHEGEYFLPVSLYRSMLAASPTVEAGHVE